MRIVLIFTILTSLISCKERQTTDKRESDFTDTIKKTENVTAQKDAKDSVIYRLSYKNIKEVVEDKKSYSWVNLANNKASCSLHFNLEGIDTLCVEYSPECWLYFTFKVTDNKIIVFWDKIIDSKYDFDIVKTIEKLGGKYKGQTFMSLELINDTTLQATYPISELVKELNSSNKERLMFPDKYSVFKKTYL